MESNLKPQIVSACRRLLRPVVRLLLKASINWKEFAEISKAVFVDVASAEFGIRGRPTNASRVAMLTGINRHEVSRQRALLNAAEPDTPTYLNAAQRVLSGWHQDPAYLATDGRPMAISEAGEAPSFQDLCRRYGGDMPATALLRELRRVRAVGDGPDGNLVAQMRSYIQAEVNPEKLLRAGSVIEDLGDTVVHDLTAPAGAGLRFERRAENSGIDPRDVPAFQQFLEAEGMALLERIDDWLTRHEQLADERGASKRIRLGAGLYHIQNEPSART